uniref:Uncharacterized protein n=1 Tax=Anguilla anguilla TaxID=7936 RepID=A0A0E9QZ73_ANGAN
MDILKKKFGFKFGDLIITKP